MYNNHHVMKGIGWCAQSHKKLHAYILLTLFCRQVVPAPIKFVYHFLFIQLQKFISKRLKLSLSYTDIFEGIFWSRH